MSPSTPAVARAADGAAGAADGRVPEPAPVLFPIAPVALLAPGVPAPETAFVVWEVFRPAAEAARPFIVAAGQPVTVPLVPHAGLLAVSAPGASGWRVHATSPAMRSNWPMTTATPDNGSRPPAISA